MFAVATTGSLEPKLNILRAPVLQPTGLSCTSTNNGSCYRLGLVRLDGLEINRAVTVYSSECAHMLQLTAELFS